MAVDRDPSGRPADHDHPDEVVARAAGTLREITDAGWVRAREAVLERVRRTLRPAPHVAGRHSDGQFTVATPVLVDRLRRAVDGATPARVLDVQVDVGPEVELDGVALRLSVAYGSPIGPDAEAARAAVLAEVERTLGVPLEPARVTVDVHIADVHVTGIRSHRRQERENPTPEGPGGVAPA
ncbi:hypothetical protein [Cellulomonas sp. PS-H5]|uniref:hypothetical protein n=1 Tax=Cellulomonas sp. PS-H5 TaxID=2820400 RepID=UPI001C4E9CCF|nr:hypothetical protein [Cellulomonas sp. PS-H5]MBW0253473.1 hypothetical protein [Cellulomonas sp. PS-H5]